MQTIARVSVACVHAWLRIAAGGAHISFGVALGKWVIDQRQVFRGKKRGCLCPSRMARLDALEFVWSPSERVRDVRWVERALYRM